MVLRGDRTFSKLLDKRGWGGGWGTTFMNATLGEWAQTHQSVLLYSNPSLACLLSCSGLLAFLIFHHVTMQFQALARCQHPALAFSQP